ncbi:MAG: DUF1573 domain-containing protein [Pirellulaceae bacterium]
MRKLLPAIIMSVTFLIVCCLPLFSNHFRVYTVHTDVTADGTVVRTPKVTSVAHLRNQKLAPGPQAQVDSAVHDFGRMDPLTVQEHVFVVRNVGDAPLELFMGPTTCKCTLAKLGQQAVPPGGKTHVALQWNTGRDLAYAQSATIFTNDPRNKALQFSIKGTVSALFRCSPEQLVFSRIVPGETPSATAVVYSQAWDDMELEPITPSLSGMTVTISEVDSSERDTLQAKSARRITVTLPADLPEGYFTTPLVLRGKPAGGSSEQMADCELGIEGKVIRRLAVYGPEIEVNGMIDMGRVRQGNLGHVRLLMKLRDTERNLPVKHIESTPSFLHVWVEPFKTDESKELGLYYLHVEVPKDAPTFRLPPNERGMIRIEFDHPRVTKLELPLDLIVIPRDGV